MTSSPSQGLEFDVGGGGRNGYGLLAGAERFRFRRAMLDKGVPKPERIPLQGSLISQQRWSCNPLTGKLCRQTVKTFWELPELGVMSTEEVTHIFRVSNAVTKRALEGGQAAKIGNNDERGSSDCRNQTFPYARDDQPRRHTSANGCGEHGQRILPVRTALSKPKRQPPKDEDHTDGASCSSDQTHGAVWRHVVGSRGCQFTAMDWRGGAL